MHENFYIGTRHKISITMVCDVFLSYSRIKDQYEGVSKFREHLEWSLRLQSGNTHFTIFQDKRLIEPGDRFDERIMNALDSANALIILYSPTWFTSNWCKEEYRRFTTEEYDQGRNRPIIVVKWGKVINTDFDDETANILDELDRIQHFEWGVNLQYGQWESSDLKIEAAKLSTAILSHLK